MVEIFPFEYLLASTGHQHELNSPEISPVVNQSEMRSMTSARTNHERTHPTNKYNFVFISGFFLNIFF